MGQHKVCGRCGAYKSADDFAKNPSRKDGRASACKLCVKASRELDRGKRLKRAKEYRIENRDIISLKKREYYLKMKANKALSNLYPEG